MLTGLTTLFFDNTQAQQPTSSITHGPDNSPLHLKIPGHMYKYGDGSKARIVGEDNRIMMKKNDGK